MKQLTEQWQIEKSNKWFDTQFEDLTENFSKNMRKLLIDFKPKLIEDLEIGLFYYGKSRTGKTIAMTKKALDWHYSRFCLIRGLIPTILIIKVPDLFENLRNMFNDIEEKQEVIQNLKSVKLLVLDDLGANKMTDWTMEVLYSIIDYRYEEMKTTYYTSNFSLEELQERMDDDRLVGRIKNQCKENIIEFTNEPYL